MWRHMVLIKFITVSQYLHFKRYGEDFLEEFKVSLSLEYCAFSRN